VKLQQDDHALNEQLRIEYGAEKVLKVLEPLVTANEAHIEECAQELAEPSIVYNDVPASNNKQKLRKHPSHRGLASADAQIQTRPKAMSAPRPLENMMEDLTQKSAMSATQANSESVYDHFPIKHESGTKITKDHSVITESTAITYGENDTGHVNFDSYMPAADESADNGSQDESFVQEGEVSPVKSYEPRTPAPAVNPFTHKGSVMRGHEMFGATQPSSIGRHLPSGVSSRPSPEIYNDFTSPIKGKPLASSPPPSSPLLRRNDTSPLQSSARNLMRAKSMEEQSPQAQPHTVTEQTQSSDLGHRFVSSFPVMEPRQYIPMNQSQERRVQQQSSIPRSDPGNTYSDSDIEMDDAAERKRRIDAKTRRQLSEVSVQRTDVEVPSTGRKERRRSTEEEYIAQCSGLDARDTQTQPPTQEVIADSQTVELPTFSTAQTHVPESDSEGRLPACKLQSDVGVIPETSPPSSDHCAPILPMGDVASLSFGGETQDIDAPGFTQDIGFEEVMHPFSSQESLRSPHRRREPVVPNTNNALSKEIDFSDITKGSSTPAKGNRMPILDESPSIGETEASSVKIAQDTHIALIASGAANIKSPIRPVEEAANRNMNVGDVPVLFTKEPVEEVIRIAPKRKLQKTGTPASTVQTPTPRRSLRAKPTSTSTVTMPPSRSSRRSSSALSTPLSSVPPSMPSPIHDSSPSIVAATKSTNNRKHAIPKVEPVSTRTSKRKGAPTRDSSGDPLAGPTTTSVMSPHQGLFFNMAFAVSYVKQSKEKDGIAKKLSAHGGQILEDGFGVLFEPLTLQNQDTDLHLSPLAQSAGFVALIADEHSRKAKYIEALALGLPCLSGRWVDACVAKGQIVGWAPYLLCAGHSSFLNAFPSRMLRPYSAIDARFAETFEGRERMLNGMSILIVTGKGHSAEARKAYIFLTRILGPSQLVQVVDYDSARTKLLEYEEKSQPCDLVYVDNEKAADIGIFGSISASRSNKRRSRAVDSATPAPKRVRMVNDEVIVQSLIIGKFLEEYL